MVQAAMMTRDHPRDHLQTRLFGPTLEFIMIRSKKRDSSTKSS